METQSTSGAQSSDARSAVQSSVEQAKKVAAKAPKTDAELRALMSQIIDNPEMMRDVDDDDIIALRDRINPIGTFIPAKKSCAVMSVVHMKEEYTRKLMTTAMIGFLYRRLEEYEPEFVVSMEEAYAQRINGITADSAPGANDMQQRRDQLREECKRKSDAYKSAHRDAIRSFLNSVFAYNPDKHVRKATSADVPENAIDVINGTIAMEALAQATSDAQVAASAAPAGAAPKTPSQEEARDAAARNPLIVGAVREAVSKLREERAKYACASDASASDAGASDVSALQDTARVTYENAEIIYRNARICEANALRAYGLISQEMVRMDTSPERNAMEDARQLLETCRTRFANVAASIGPYASARSVLETMHPLAVIPPADVFHNFGRYVDAHYEILRIITDALYSTTSDMEDIVIYYDSFESEDEAREFMRVHEAEFRAEPRIIENGGVTLIAPFRENRERVDFYTRNTEVLRLMMEQVTRDQQIGKDMAKKRIAVAKRRNVREAGPDDAAGLERYMGARQIISQFGSRPELTREDRIRLAEAEQTRAEFETPADALAVRMLRPVLDDNGVPTDLQQSFFYTEATNVPVSK